MAAAIAHSLATIAPEKAMEYDSIYIEHMAEILVIIKQLENINNGKADKRKEFNYESNHPQSRAEAHHHH